MYDISVEDQHEFFANGVLVHNCFYALTYRMGKARRPDELDFAEEAAKIVDPVARWFYIQKHRKKTARPIIEPKIIMPWEV